MYHESNVLFVDSQSERIGGDDHLCLAAHEGILDSLAISRWTLAVIQSYVVALRQHLVKALRLLYRRNIDDARAFALAEDLLENRILDAVVDGSSHLEPQIGAGKSSDRDVRILHAELVHDVVLHLLRRGGGECENRRSTEALGD